jgi:hypothetical protein
MSEFFHECSSFRLHLREEIMESDDKMNKTCKGVLRIFAVTVCLCFAAWVYVAQPSWRPPSVSPLHQPHQGPSLKETVRTLSVDFHPRDVGHPENLRKTADWIADHFKNAGGKVTRQQVDAWGTAFENVSCFFDGPGDRRIVVGAHYDAYLGTPGADDNASGVAGLIEIAYQLGQLEPGCDVELVAYCPEEPPYFGTRVMGSAVHAAALQRDGVEVVGMIALEMIGFFSDQPDSQAYPIPALALLYPSRGTFIAVISRLDQREMVGKVKRSMKKIGQLPVYSFVGPVSLNGIDFSDHRSYWESGVPAVMVTNTAFYRNHEYHEPGDTADRLDYDRMRQVTQAVILAVLDLADAPAAP